MDRGSLGWAEKDGKVERRGGQTEWRIQTVEQEEKRSGGRKKEREEGSEDLENLVVELSSLLCLSTENVLRRFKLVTPVTATSCIQSRRRDQMNKGERTKMKSKIGQDRLNSPY